MIDRWDVIGCPPGRHDHPDGIAADWDDAVVMTPATTVAAACGAAAVGRTDDRDWWARARVELAEPTSVLFAGLTHPATVYVDGTVAAHTRSMFLPVEVTLPTGHHEIVVAFGSLTQWLRTRRPRGRWRSSLVAEPGLRWARTTLLGRAPFYGDLPAPVGFWRPVDAVAARLRTRVAVHARLADGPDAAGTVTVRGTSGAAVVGMVLTDPAGAVVARAQAPVIDGDVAAALTVDRPRRWWPRGYGPPDLYTLTIDADGTPVATRVVGFRDLAVSRGDGGFAVSVNGVTVFCRGAAWVPPDPVACTVDDATMDRHIGALAAAGATMVRVVGGLLPEQPAFWEACARAGLLVWQDAMLATFDLPTELADVVGAELAHVLDAVSGNPSLAVVSGGSETLQRPEMLGRAAADSAMAVLTDTLPTVAAAHGVPYVPASPCAPGSAPATGLHGDLAIRPDTGVAHWFGVGGYLRPLTDVRTAGVRFAAECLAFAVPPSPDAVDRHFGGPAAAGHRPDWKAGVPRDRGASWDFEDVRDHYVREVFGESPATVRRVDPARYLALGRLAVAEAMRACFSFWRRADSGCDGALVLAARDTRPGAGLGLLDVDGDPKAVLAVLARLWAPVAVTLADDGLAGVRIDVHNDTAATLRGALTLRAVNAVGARVVEVIHEVDVAAHSSLTLRDAALTGTFGDLSHAFRFGPPAADAIEAVFTAPDGDRGVTARDVWVVVPRPGQPPAGTTAVAHLDGDGRWWLTVTAAVSLRGVVIEAAGWRASDDVFDLLGGSPHTVELSATDDATRPVGTVTSIDQLAPVPIAVAS